MLADALIKNAAMNARWQIQKLKALRPGVIISVDEPYLAAFGSAFISLERHQVITMLDEVFEAIHQDGALASVHCCANTDWSVLLATTVDILNLDAYGYLENLALYPAELHGFLDRGGAIMWGIVPNNEDIFQTTPEALASQLREGIDLIKSKAQARGVNIISEHLAQRSLITTSCGLGPTSVEIADRSLEILAQTSKLLQGG
jgi:methionine synthase II (cobalamin-independent)